MSNAIIKEYTYNSGLAPIITQFVTQKRTCGFIYNSEAKMLARFDRYLIAKNINDTILSSQTFLDYTAKTSYESYRNHRARILLLTQFARYLHQVDSSSYLPTHALRRAKETTFIPYIFTNDEISKLFEQADLYNYKNKNSHLNEILPVIFRLLYACGLRVSEATHLLYSDVDLENGILTINDSKFGNSRLVPIHANLRERLECYAEIVHKSSTADAVFFPTAKGDFYTEKAIYQNFRKLLWSAGISHGGKGNGPRLHDLRHTYAVNCLKKWVNQDVDINALLPFLSAYLGHSGLSGTQRYLRLTADMFPKIMQTLETLYGDIIPSVGGGFDYE